MEGTVLWENSKPTEGFSGKTITIPTDYDYFDIEYTQSSSVRIGCDRVFPGKSHMLSSFTYSGANKIMLFIREVILSSDAITITNGRLTVDAESTATYNDALVPLRIIGYKS